MKFKGSASDMSVSAVYRAFALATVLLATLLLEGCDQHGTPDGQVLEVSRRPVSAHQSWQQTIVQYATTIVVPTSLGNQSVDLMPDTGSFDLIVSSVLCESCKHHRYRATESKFFRIDKPMRTKTFRFGSGSLEAFQGFDSFVAGPFSTQQMPLWLITELSPNLYSAWAKSEFEGILGLGHSRSTASQELGIHQFALCLRKYDVSAWWNGGVLHWNGRDESLDWGHGVGTTGDFHWELGADSVHLGGKDLCATGGCTAILDSGTSILAVPRETAPQLQSSLPDIPQDCSLTGLPDLRIALAGGPELVLPPASYVMKFDGDTSMFEALSSSGSIVWKRQTDQAGNGCAAIFQVTDSGSWVLGMPLFRAYAVHFDRSASMVSFAENVGNTCGKTDQTALAARRERGTAVIEVQATDMLASVERSAQASVQVTRSEQAGKRLRKRKKKTAAHGGRI